MLAVGFGCLGGLMAEVRRGLVEKLEIRGFRKNWHCKTAVHLRHLWKFKKHSRAKNRNGRYIMVRKGQIIPSPLSAWWPYFCSRAERLGGYRALESIIRLGCNRFANTHAKTPQPTPPYTCTTALNQCPNRDRSSGIASGCLLHPGFLPPFWT